MVSFKLTPFLFVICLCAVLGLALLFVPFVTFKSVKVLSSSCTDSKQLIVHQQDRYSALVVESTNATATSVYVFDAKHHPKITNDTWQERLERKETLKPTGVLTIEFETHNGTVGVFLPTGDKSLVLEVDGRQINNTHDEVVFADFGKHTAALRNTGKEQTEAKLTVMLSTRYFNMTNGTTVGKCERNGACKLQRLPRGYTAFINIAMSGSPNAVRVTATEQYDDLYRWMFPLLIYSVLLLIVIVTGIAQYVYIRRFKTHTYAAIN